MKLLHEKYATRAQGIWLESGVVALARRTIERMGQALTSTRHPARGVEMSPEAARRTDPLPFADTEASWHHL